jgi:hypothetical protein
MKGDAQPLVILTALAKALSDAAASVDKFADGLTKLAKLGDFVGLPIGEAKRARQRLLNMRARTTRLIGQQQQVFPGQDEGGESLIERYIAAATPGASPPFPSPPPPQWGDVRAAISNLVRQVAELLRDVESERSGFVAEPTYKEFVEVLRARVSILQRLQNMPAPVTSEEIRELAIVRDRYAALIERLDRANDALAEYIKAAERAPG